MNLPNRQIPVCLAKQIAKVLKGKGLPSPGKVLICTPSGEITTQSGIILSSVINEKDLPRKGVIIQSNNLELFPKEQLMVGTIVTYGMYAGKEVNFDEDTLPFINLKDYKFTILSESEIVYIETNN